jgi:hypothetical protein
VHYIKWIADVGKVREHLVFFDAVSKQEADVKYGHRNNVADYPLVYITCGFCYSQPKE